MPYAGEISAKISEPDTFDKLRRQNNKFGTGVHAVFGTTKDNLTSVQALRFDASKFSLEAATEWLRSHEYKPILIEDAAPVKEAAEFQRFARELGLDFTPHILEQDNGAMLIKDVKLLAEGEWTDSAMGTPLFYPAKALETYAHNWLDTSVWSRHTGGVPRSITDKIGEIRNPHYADRAVVGDVYLHGLTAASKDVIELVKGKQANYVSVEHGGDERYNPETKRMEAQNLFFTGLAVVNRGACARCRINSAAIENLTVMGQASIEAPQTSAQLSESCGASEQHPGASEQHPETKETLGTMTENTTPAPVEVATPVVAPVVEPITQTYTATGTITAGQVVAVTETVPVKAELEAPAVARELETLKEENKALREALDGIEKSNKELAETLKSLSESINSLSAMDARLKAVEASPVEAKTVLGASEDARQLEEPKLRISTRGGVVRILN